MGDKSILDYTLVPAGVLVLLLYHLYLLRRIVVRPSTTVIGVNAIKRRIWVHAMMSDQAKNGMLAVQILHNHLNANTVMASTSITLCSLIAVLLNYTSSNTGILYGDDSDVVRSIKYFSILLCFLMAFLCNIEAIRYYNHASFLFNVPLGSDSVNKASSTVEYVVRAVNRGSYWSSLGLKAFYFSFPLLLWVFGPIPMSVCSVVMVVLLYFLDSVPPVGKKEEGRSREAGGPWETPGVGEGYRI